jgi:hypothetical protein
MFTLKHMETRKILILQHFHGVKAPKFLSDYVNVNIAAPQQHPAPSVTVCEREVRNPRPAATTERADSRHRARAIKEA